jgi:pimeloyl-ACP methyl ester carboxylesterase
VAAVDLRGHGRSDKPEGGYDFATLAADLVAALDGLGWGRAVVAGQSTGGNLAVEVAWRWPERVAGVAGIDGGVLEPWRQWPAWEDCRRALAPPVLTGVPAAEVEARIRAEHPGWEDEAVVATMANLEVLPDGTVRPWLAREHHLCILRALWEHRPSTLVAGLPVPVLLVLAGGGSDGGPSVEEARRNPLVRVEWLEGSHDLHVERPDDVALLLAGMAAS